MAEHVLEGIRELLEKNRKVHVNDLSERFGISRVSVRKHLGRLESRGLAVRFYGGAALADPGPEQRRAETFHTDPQLGALAMEARQHIADGDSLFIGSGRTCCVLARRLAGLQNLTVVTNNITALPDLFRNAVRVFLIGGEVTTTDGLTLFSSWDLTSNSLPGQVSVNKAFTSTSGLDIKAGLTVDSIISTYLFRRIPLMARHWYLMAGSAKFDRIAMYPVGELGNLHTLITDRIPRHYAERLAELNVRVVRVDQGEDG